MIYYLTSPESVNRKVELKYPMDDPEIQDWSIKTDKGRRILTIKGKGKVYASLVETNGVFRGKDIRGGFTVMRPEKPPVHVRTMPNRQRPRSANIPDRRFAPVTEYQAVVDKIVDGYPKAKDDAIVIMGCDRPDYLKQVIEGLKKSDLSNYDVYLFLDKPKDPARFRLTETQEKLGISDRIVKFPVNFGCGRAIIDARRQIFDRMGYTKAFFFEDDMVPAPGYVQFCEALLKWGQKHYNNVGAVQGWTKCLMSKEEKAKLERQVYVTFTNWWGYLTTREAWNEVKDFIYVYRDKFLLGDYKTRPTPAILQYFKPFANGNFKASDGGVIPDDNSLKHRRVLFDSIPSGQDGATWIAYDKAGLVRLAPVVNRGLYIGRDGIHSTPEIYRKQRFDKMTLDTFDGDTKKRVFNLR